MFLPEYPRTPHLAYKPNMAEGDVLSELHESLVVLNNPNIFVQEKVDGANCAILMDPEGNPVIRNRNNMLKKGYLKDTPAKMQFRPIWNWFYENKEKFEALNKHFREPVAVYGEWCLAVHGIVYNRIADYFMPFDIYIPSRDFYLRPDESWRILNDLGFSTPLNFVDQTTKFKLPITTFEELDPLLDMNSEYSTLDKVEGLYIKVFDSIKVTHRFKLIRPGYVQGGKWSHETLVKQKYF